MADDDELGSEWTLASYTPKLANTCQQILSNA